MHTFVDLDTNVVFNHNGDYSGEVLVRIPLAVEEGWSAPAAVDFDVPDVAHAGRRSSLSWLTPDVYGMTFELTQGRPFVEIRLPAKLLVRFAGQAVLSGVVSQLESLDVEDLF